MKIQCPKCKAPLEDRQHQMLRFSCQSFNTNEQNDPRWLHESNACIHRQRDALAELVKKLESSHAALVEAGDAMHRVCDGLARVHKTGGLPGVVADRWQQARKQ